MTRTIRGFGLAFCGAMIGVLVVQAVIAALNGDFMSFGLFAILGGLAASVVVAALHSQIRPETSADPFVRDVFAGEILNFSRLRVAGIGGAGLVFVSALVALQFQLIAVTVALGMVGGAITGVGLIAYRRRPDHKGEHHGHWL